MTFADLEIDTDLSWQLLVSLAAGGVVTAADIDAALAADNTAKGGEFAAQAKAALPTAEAKTAAWSSLVDSDDLPNTIVRAAAAGFMHPAGRDLLDGFVGRYFDAAAADLGIAHLPDRAVPDRRALPRAARERRPARCHACAGSRRNADAAPALRRLVAENLAGVERALSVQDRDAQ